MKIQRSDTALSTRPTVAFVGPLGTGKTEVALNYGLASAAAGRETYLVDLDVVTPYFRAGEHGESLMRGGVRLIAPEGGLAYYENPALSPEIAGVLRGKVGHVVIDAGGDPSGARPLGVYGLLLKERGYDMWMVLNPFRPVSGSVVEVGRQRETIEVETGLKVTGLVLNPHVGRETRVEQLVEGLSRGREIAGRLGLKVAAAALEERFAEKETDGLAVLAMKLMLRLPWEE